MREESLRLTIGKSEGTLTVVVTGSAAQLQHVRKAVLVAASEAKDMEGKGAKPCGCTGS